MQSYPTPPDIARVERMNDGFLKLFSGAPIHYFTECHDDHFHTHPFEFVSHVIVGGYREELLILRPDGRWQNEIVKRLPGTSHRMPLDVPHRLIGLLDGPCITRCEYGPTVQKPGFIQLEENGQAFHRYWDEQDWQPYPRAA